MARVEITGEQYALADVFSNKFLFSIPPYQRPYSWTNEHAGELFDDLLSFMGDGNEQVADLSPYFLGSVVLIKDLTPPAEIVDGQQRLVTLTILLSTLRSSVPQKVADAITKVLYEPEDPLTGHSARYRLRLRPKDGVFFQTYIQEDGSLHALNEVNPADLNDAQRNVRDNALFLLSRVRELAEGQRIRLAQFIVQRCLLVVVSTPDLDSAYRIFSVLNDRGLDLSSADILKAEIIGRIQEQRQPAYTTKWEDTEEDLGRDSFQDLFGHIRMIYRKAKAKDSILKEFRRYVIEDVRDPENLLDSVVLPYAAAFSAIQNASYEHTQDAGKVNDLFRWLNRIDNADWLPPAMLFLKRNKGNPAVLVRFFADLERLAAGMMLRRYYLNRRLDRYGALLEAIDHNENLFAPNSPLQLTQEECKGIGELLNGDVYLLHARSRQYILLRLDSLLAEGTASYEYARITIEHVMPRHPAAASRWLEWFPHDDDRDRYVHRLGNLALLSRNKNAQASNYDFDKKKREYFSSRTGVANFALTTQVLAEAAWTPDVIERRQRELVGRLKQLWRL